MIKSHKFILNDGRILLVTGYDYTLSIVDPLVDEPEEVPCFDTYPAPPLIPPTPGPNASLQEKAELMRNFALPVLWWRSTCVPGALLSRRMRTMMRPGCTTGCLVTTLVMTPRTWNCMAA